MVTHNNHVAFCITVITILLTTIITKTDTFLENDHPDLDILHFEDEETFLAKFEEELQNLPSSYSTRSRPSCTDQPGEFGKPVVFSNVSLEHNISILAKYTEYGYNKYISDMIPLDRKLPEARSDWYNFF